MLKRLLQLNLPQKQSAFLWGGRKTGKSTYLGSHFPNSQYYDLLQTDLYLKLSKEPYLLRQELLALPAEKLAQPVIIYEVQKIPLLLNEIHWLIENSLASFILCGSSTRKLNRGAANVLGGRAWRYEFYPLVTQEIPDCDLKRALNHGLLPSHYLTDQPQRSLKAYVEDYLKKEIQAEGLTRNLPGFARFLDAMALTHGELINYTNIARDCGVDAKTIKEYYQILIDTLLGYYIYPYRKKTKRDIIIATPKFYLFDIGVVNHLKKRVIHDLVGFDAGNAFEHFILMELIAYRCIKEKDFPITFWRTKTGLKVDFILGEAEVAIEVILNTNPAATKLKGLAAFAEEAKPKRAIVVARNDQPRKMNIVQQQIDILPWQQFLQQLWNGEII